MSIENTPLDARPAPRDAAGPAVVPRGGAATAGIAGAIGLARPPNCVLTAVSVWVGALAAGRPSVTLDVAAAATGAALVAAAGNTVNDVADLAVDRVNRPARPLPSGRVSAAAALGWSGLLAAIGLLLAFEVGAAAGVMAATVLLGLLAYSWGAKRSGLPGNLLVGLLAAATFPFGALAAGSLEAGGRYWIPAAFALLYHLARELVKGVEDAAGDRRAGVRTLAVTRGPATASRLAAILLLVVALAAPAPALAGVYGTAYLAPVAALDLFLLRVTIRLWRGPEAGGGRLSRRLLLGMVLGLTAVVLGELVDRG